MNEMSSKLGTLSWGHPMKLIGYIKD